MHLKSHTAAILIGYSLLCQGCIDFYIKKPVHVRVVDAETAHPISDTEVSVHYPYYLSINPPQPVQAVTDTEGRCTLSVANFHSVEWEASAEGYLSHSISVHMRNRRVPYEFLDDGGVLIRLYREPSPKLIITIKDGYRGPLMLDIRPSQSWIHDRVGSREFFVDALDDGYVGIDASPLLFRWISKYMLDIVFRYESGTLVPKHDYRISDTDIALRWVTLHSEWNRVTSNFEWKRYLFVVGSADDMRSFQRLVFHYIDGDPPYRTSNRAGFNALFVRPLED